jgi:hypothetical protein
MSLLIETLVCVLLVVTILYCVRLERQLQRLRADDTSMRKTVADLSMAADRAEAAIAGLRRTATEGEKGLGERLKEVETVAAALARETEAGETVLARIAQIVSSQRIQTEAEKARELKLQLERQAAAQVAETKSAPEKAVVAAAPIRLDKLTGAAQAARELARRAQDVTAEAA